MRIYHYTTIDTLALILNNKTIRFNRLDNLDDLQECVTDEKMNYNLGQYVFVSCWTDNPQEQLGLWKLYTQGKGVRISMEHDMFKTYNCSGHGVLGWNNYTSYVPQDDSLMSSKDYFFFLRMMGSKKIL